MAGVTLGFLKYVLGLDTIAFRKGMTDAERDLVKLQKSFEAKGRQFEALGKGITAFVTLPMAGLAAAGLKEAQETATAMAQVGAAIKSTGGAAGVTAQELKAASDALELKSLYEGDEILKNVSARLLAFGAVSGDTFKRAQQDIIDYATRTGTELGAATVLIGKALSDPAKAMGTLRKAGVVLTESQQALVKQFVATGNTAGAQNVILSALEQRYKGAAEAAQNADPWNKLQDSFKNLAETVGTALLPVLPKIADAVAAVVGAFTSLPSGVQTTIIAFAGITAVLGPTLIGLGGLISIIAKIGPAVTALSATWTALSTAFAAARVAALATLPALIPFLIPLAAIAAAVGVAYLAWKNWDKIKAIVSGVWQAVKTMVDTVGKAISSMVAGVTSWLMKLEAPFKWVHDKAKMVGDAFATLYDRVVGHSYIPDMVDEIGQHIARLDGLLVQPVDKMTGAAAAAFKALQDKVQPLRDLLAKLFPESVENNQYLADLATLNGALKDGKLSADEYLAALNRLEQQAGVVKLDLPAFDSVPKIEEGNGPNQIPSFQSYIDQAKAAKDATSMWAGAMGELSEIGRHALDSLNNGITDVLLHSHSLKDAWHNLGTVIHGVAEQVLGDLLKWSLKMAEMALFKAVIGGFSEGGPVGFATGGFVSGPGTATSDSIPALLSNGEFVVNAAATKKLRPLLEHINSGALRHFASGGMVTMSRAANDRMFVANDMPAITLVNHNDFRGADATAVAGIRARIDRMEADLPSRAVEAVRNAQTRTFGRAMR